MYTFSDIARILQVSPFQQNSNPVIESVLTDSRKLIVPDSTLFFTIHSTYKSANIFIPELYQKGVRCFVVDGTYKSTSELKGANFLQVDNVLEALQAIAIHHRNLFSLPVVGITGSNGKTVVKEWLDQLLYTAYHIVKSPKSYNSQVGVPLSVWQISSSHELGIFEAGISSKQEMEKLEKMIRPKIGIVTSIGDAHAAGFKSLKEKINEKLKLFLNAEVLIYNSDEPLLTECIDTFKTKENKNLKIFSWGKSDRNSLVIRKVSKSPKFTSISCVFENKHFDFQIPFTDDASIQNAVTCSAFLIYLKVPFTVIEEKLHHLRTVEMRLELKHGINNCSVINDSYSADIHSLNIALDFLSQQNQHKDKTVIISDILQQRNDAGELYAKLALILSGKGITRLIGIGEQIQSHRQLFERIPVCLFFNSTADFLAGIDSISFRNETILLKGARVFGFERISYLLEERTHETILEINLDAIRSNLKYFNQRITRGVKLMAMVKAFSYGTGSFEIANILENTGVDYLAVAYADEGVDLRKSGVRLPIMVMNTEEAGFENLVKFKLEPELYSFKITNSFISFLESSGYSGTYPVHIKLDTGMHRLGFEMPDLGNLFSLIRDSGLIEIRSVFSHLAGSEDPSLDQFTQEQMRVFTEMCNQIETTLGYKFIRHISNSSAILRHPEIQLDMVRLGIGLYGISPDPESEKELSAVGTLRTTISQIRIVKAGDTVGYNRKGKVDADTTVATVRVGYADGYPRILGNGRGQMLVNGILAPVIGNVCMDMTMLDISGIDAKEGDSVIVFGPKLSVTTVAKWAETIPYEILTGVSQRVKRVYYNE